MTALLSVRELTVSLDAAGGRRPVLDAVSLDLEAGAAHALVGESGGGKTLFARALLRLLPPAASITGGEVALDGRNILALPEREMTRVRGGRIGYVFQEPLDALDPVRPIGAQVAEAVRFHERIGARAARRRALELLDEAGLERAAGRYDAFPHALSGGMRQRVALAAALAGAPSVLVADEPTASLDAPLEAQVLDRIERLRRERGLALLLITHDLRLASRRCDRVSILYAGRIVEETTAAEFRDAPRHPYTVALAACAGETRGLSGRMRGERLPVIAGIAPSLAERGAPRCGFLPRCAHAFDRCGVEKPPFYPAGAGRARCFLYAPEAA